MSEPVFPTNGSGTPPMQARHSLMDTVWGDLIKAGTRSGSDNLTVIAPRWMGKTVLLKAVADRAIDDAESPYVIVLHWHLGHVCPTTDEEFISGLCQNLSDVMRSHSKDYSEYQLFLQNRSFSHLKEITDLLDEENEPLLMLWDGLDKPLGQENLSVHLWDQMRSLIDGKKHKIVTATRSPLDELIVNEKASTSEFWNLFKEQYIGPFNEADLESLLKTANLHFSNGGKKEVFNWTGGHPMLLLEILNCMALEDYTSTISNENVVGVAEGMVKDARRSLNSIWKECPVNAQEAFQLLVQNGESPILQIGKMATEALESRGLAVVRNRKAKPACHLMREHLGRTASDSGSLARLFAAQEDYRSNIGDVLRMRLEQIPIVDNSLRRWVDQSIQGIPDHPGDCLTNLTDVRDKALDLVMLNEFGSNLEVPEDLVEYWKYNNRNQNKVVAELNGQGDFRLPNDRAMQIGLLQLLVGGAQGLASKAKSASKDTYEMISAIHGLRNRKEHGEREPISLSVAVSTIMICLTLLELLAKELS